MSDPDIAPDQPFDAIPATVPDARAPIAGRFFFLDSSLWGDGRGAGLEIANRAALIAPGMYTVAPPNGDPAQYPERPRLAHVPAEGGMPRDFEVLAGIWIVSDALRRVFESVDPAGFAFAECDFTRADGTPGPRYHLCDVVRTLDALDEGASRVKVKVEHDPWMGRDVKLYSILGGASLAFDPGVVGNAHVFRQAGLGAPPVCDLALAHALRAADLDGVALTDVSDA